VLKQQKSKCLLCSLGCGFIIESQNDEAINLEYDTDDSVGKGALCGKGNYALELINHPMRLIDPKNDGAVVSWKEAFDGISEKLGSNVENSSAGLILGGDASLEDIATAIQFVEKCLGGGRLAVHFATGDDKVLNALANSSIPNATAGLDDIETSACTIAVGDPFVIGPVIAGRVLNAKYAKRGNMFGVISKQENTTSRFASVHASGSEREILAGLLRVVAEKSDGEIPGWKKAVRDSYPAPKDPGIVRMGEAFVKTPSAVLILETQDTVTASLAAAVVAAAGPDKKLFVMNTYGNAAGICGLLKNSTSVEEIVDAVAGGKIKALIALGADPVKGIAGRDVKAAMEKLDFLAAAGPFENMTMQYANMILPTALWMESEGTYNGSKLTPVVDPPGSALPYGEILRQLAEAIGHSLPPVSVETVQSGGEMTEGSVLALLKESAQEAPESAFRSTTIDFADGSLTDNMSWIKLQERDAW